MYLKEFMTLDRNSELEERILNIDRNIYNIFSTILFYFLEMPEKHDWKDGLLFTFSFLFGTLLISGLEVIKKFIQSKPPGRRLVRFSAEPS